MEKTTCQTCVYFRQHYGISEGRIFRLHFGHCIFSRIKTKQPSANACPQYAFAPPRENEFVSKEYLSKALLRRVLEMELLPTIEDSPIPPSAEPAVCTGPL